MPISLNISTHDVKLMATRGGVLEKWVAAPLPPDSVKDGEILEPRAVADVIDSLFKTLKLPRVPVIATISGMSFTYRWLKLPRVRQAAVREAVERATQKEIQVPLDELYLDWQVINSDRDGMDVFVLGVPRSQIDSLLKTADSIKIGIKAVDVKALALARASGLSDGLIVDFELECFNIIILSGGVPVTMHTFNPKNQRASLEDNLQQLVSELERTVDFYNLTHKEQPVCPDSPLLLTGELAANSTAADRLAQNTGRPVNLLTTRIRIPGDFPVSSFAGNIGLVLKKGAAAQHSTGKIHGDIDVDPLLGRKRAFSRPLSLRKLWLPAALATALALVILLSIVRGMEVADTAALQSQMESANRDLFLRNLALNQADETRAAIDKVEADTSALRREREAIAGKGKLSTLLSAAADNLPAGARCNNITADTGQIILEGEAATRSDVIDYVRRLEKSGLFSEVRIQSLGDETGAVFKIVIER